MSSKPRTSVSSSSKRGKPDKKESTKEEEQEPVAVPQLAWKILNESVTDRLMSLAPKELSRELATALKFNSYEIDLKEASQVDFYVAAVWFARESGLTTEQCSAFITLLHTLLENIKDKHLSIEDSIKEMKLLMTGVGVSKQMSSLQCFTVEVANKVLQYMAESILQHYQLYEFLLTEEQEEQESTHEEVHLNLPPPSESLNPAPLEEAVTEEFYYQYISPPPAPTSPTATTLAKESSEDEITQEKVEEPQQHQTLLSTLSHEEIKTMMHKVAHDTMNTYKAHIEKTLQAREADYAVKLEKLAKTIK